MEGVADRLLLSCVFVRPCVHPQIALLLHYILLFSNKDQWRDIVLDENEAEHGSRPAKVLTWLRLYQPHSKRALNQHR